jgi:tetratricopeptide (TPR) repeat protein
MTMRLISLCVSLLAVSTLCHGQTAAVRVTAPAVAGISRLEMVRLLRARDFERMDRAITSLQEAVERDIRQERSLNRAMNAFSTPDPALTPLFEAWVKARPSSYSALLARAEHYRALAWAARGDQAFKLHLARAVLDAEAALRLRPGLTNAVAVRISAAMGMKGVEECVLVFGRFYKQIGASLTVRSALSWCLLPRWGGSYEKLDTLAEEAAEHLDSNPALSVLAGMVAWDRGTTRAADHDVPGALRLYTDALRHGDHHLFLLARARIHLDRRRFGEALADIERALADAPEDTEALILRAWTLDGMGRPGEAAADVRLVAELDPYDEMLAEFRKEEVDRAVATARRRNAEGNAEAR